MPPSNFLKGKKLELLAKILPGPSYTKINYKENKYEILDEYD